MELRDRRSFLKTSATVGVAALAGLTEKSSAAAKRDFKISCDGWTFHREVFGGKIKMIDLPKILREEYQIEGLALVNTMLESPTQEYTNKWKSQAKKYEITIPLIMCDAEGSLGHKDKTERDKAVRNHEKWVYMASDLGCHSIRVNWHGAEGGAEKDAAKAKEVIDRSTETFGKLVEIGVQSGLNVIIENHGGISSYPEHLVGLMKAVNNLHFGTLPDFGNFPPNVDRYDAVDKMMPYAKAVSAKCYDFGPDGNETKIDFAKMMEICVDKHGFHGLIGVEFEGDRMTERDGLKAGRDLLIKLRG